jgi:RimJ/RimL family protein N-acetyltransferase
MEIRGERIKLRGTTEDDLPDLMALWNDGRVMKWVGFSGGLGYDSERLRTWFSRLQADADRHHFVIRDENSGFCGEAYYAVDRLHKRAALDIKLIPEAQRRGVATDALKTLIAFVFKTETDAGAVWTEPSEENFAARKLYERCGLRPKPRPADMEQGPSYWEFRKDENGL